MKKHIEDDIQEACVQWFRMQYRKLDILLFAVPNGGRRNAIEASRLKKQGVTSGVSDLILLVPNNKYSSLCIEIKTDIGKQTENQKIWQARAELYNNKYVIVRSLVDFIKEINEYLKDL